MNKYINQQNVHHVAKLANLPLTKEEVKKFQAQLSSILEYVSKIGEVRVGKIEPFAHATGSENVFRTDKATAGLTTKEAFSNSKNTKNNLFKISAIFTNG